MPGMLKTKTTVPADGGATKKLKLNDPTASKCDVIAKALGQGSELPEDIRRLVVDILPLSVAQPKDQRHAFQTEMVNMVGKMLSTKTEGLEAEIKIVQERLQELHDKESVLKDQETKDQAKFEETEELTRKRIVELAAEAQEFRTAKRIFTETKEKQKREDADLESTSEKKQQLEAATKDMITPLSEGLPEAEASQSGKMIDGLIKLLNNFGFEQSLITALKPALHKKPADRGDFDIMCFKELKDEVCKRVAAFVTILQGGEAGRQERAAAVKAAEETFNAAREKQNASASLYTSAQSEQEAVSTAMKEAHKALRDLGQQVRSCNKSLDHAKKRLDAFNNGPLAAFKELEDHQSVSDDSMKVDEETA